MTTRASGCITPVCPRRAASAAASSPSLRASSASPSSRHRSTMPATVCAPSAPSPPFRTSSVATRLNQRASGRCARALLGVVLALSTAAHAYGQPKTDVVTLANGDRITGEVVALERGRLKFETDDAGTLYLEWDKLASVVAARLVEVSKSDGTRFL